MTIKITVSAGEAFDEKERKFVDIDPVVLEFEHSLVSLSKWESEFEKPFLTEGQKTTEETMAYLRHMLLTPNVSEETLSHLKNEDIERLQEYIAAKRSATWFREKSGPKRSSETITSELIYYWMVAMTIDWEAQHWHLNRLLTLIRVCNEKNAPPKKMSRAEMAAQRRALNAQRRQQYGTKG